MRGMRGVGLVLVDPRCRGVLVLLDAVLRGRRGAGQRHEAQVLGQVVGRSEHAVRAADDRIVRVQRDVDRAVAALGDEVEAVVEELAEDRHDVLNHGERPMSGDRFLMNSAPSTPTSRPASSMISCNAAAVYSGVPAVPAAVTRVSRSAWAWV